jgi:hypothetical protein
MKNRLAISISLFTLAVIGIFIYQNQTVPYNLNPDTNKVIGSQHLRDFSYTLPINSIDDPVGYADLIIIGEVVSDGVVTKEEFPKVEGDDKGETVLSNLPPVTVTKTPIKIDKIIYGKADSEIITLIQLGDQNWGVTKVKKNSKMLLILHKGNNQYGSVCWEDSMFKIDDNGKVMSLSNEISIAKYDGTNIALLEKDIIKGLKNKNKLTY